jgi:hypothetical protein
VSVKCSRRIVERLGGHVIVEVDRQDLHRTRIVDDGVRSLAPGEARLRVDGFALTANNVSYAAAGDALGYWSFFPASPGFPPAPGADGEVWGRVPVWGFADVVESTTDVLPVGRRVYGYLPMADELIVVPGRVDERGWFDLAEHRQPMAGAYNRYLFTDADPVYDAAHEDRQMVLWPLFFTSFVIDDFLDDQARFGANRVIVSSASSKTAIGVGRLLERRGGIDVVGLTSAGNADFVRDVGCWSSVITYDEVATLDPASSVFVDVAGNADVRHAVHAHLGDALAHSMLVGATHWDAPTTTERPAAGPRPTFFFAPTQIAKRTREWGRDGVDERIGRAWADYAPWSDTWLRYERVEGAEATRDAFAALVRGEVDPRLAVTASIAATR